MKNINKNKIKNWGSIVTVTVNRRVMIIIIRVSLLKSQSRELVGDQWVKVEGKIECRTDKNRSSRGVESSEERALSLPLSLSLSLYNNNNKTHTKRISISSFD